jgi:hypothetical protein
MGLFISHAGIGRKKRAEVELEVSAFGNSMRGSPIRYNPRPFPPSADQSLLHRSRMAGG